MCVTGPTVAVIRKVDDVTQKMQNRDMFFIVYVTTTRLFNSVLSV